MAVRKASASVAMVLALSLAAAGCSSKNKHNGTPGPSGSGGPFAVDTSACPASANTALEAGQPIKIGTTGPLSGPLAAVGTGIAAGEQAYFNKVNAEQGGVDGHQLQLLAKDDGYDPTKTVPAVTGLVNDDKILATLAQIGTANVLASQPLMEHSCTPQLWVGTGAPQFGDPTHHAWTTLGLTPYSTEATAWADYIAAKKPGAKVAYLAIDNDSGQAYTSSFDAAAQKDGLTVVDKEKHSPTATNVDAQITAILASNPDYVIGMTAGGVCVQISAGLAQGGFKGGVIGAANCGSLTALNAAGAAADGQLSIGFTGRDPANPADAGNPDIVQFKADWAKYGNPQLPAALLSQVITGYRFGVMAVATLKAAAAMPGGLTRVDVMNAAWHLNTPLFGVYGGTGAMNAPTDNYLVEYGVWLKYDAATKSLVPTGDVVDQEGKSGQFQG